MQYLLALLLLLPELAFTQYSPIKHAHSHNDYQRSRPLFMALESGFTSIEADVFHYRGKLKISHMRIGLKRKRTLEELYLLPLQKVVEQNKGTVFTNSPVQLILMIDIKGEGTKVYHLLKKILSHYEPMLSRYNRGIEVKKGPVCVLLSGAVPWHEIAKDTTALFTADAPVSDSLNSEWVSRYSSPWGKYFKWKGKGDMPENETLRLAELINQVHQQNKEIRFYRIPDKPMVWKMLLDSGVDWINTDYPVLFRSFYLDVYRR